jgi:hypothetical protein
MKNLLCLFLAVTMFACSDDDSSDTNDNNNNSSTKKIISIQVVEDVDNICLDGSNFTFSYSGDDITSLTRNPWVSPCPNTNQTSWLYGSGTMVTNYIYSSNKIVVSSEFDYYNGYEHHFDDNGLLTTISSIYSAYVDDDVIFQNGKLLALSGHNFVWLNNNLVQTSIASATISYNYSNIDNKTDFISQFFYPSGDLIFGLQIPLIKKGLLGELSSKLPSSCTISDPAFGHINLNYEYILDDEGYPIYISVTKYYGGDRETKVILELTYTN